MPIVSIIVPNHNYADFIADAIGSIKSQTLTDFECIIIDDASTDNSRKIIRDLIKNDSRFQLLTNDEPIGVSASRNRGLDVATGEYVAFLDSDDCYTEYALEMLVNVARNANVDVAGGVAKFVNGHFRWGKSNEKWNAENYTVGSDFSKMLMAKSDQKWIWIWRRIYKRSLFDGVRFVPEMKINGDDILFMLDIAYKTRGFAESKTPVVYHRVHPLSITFTSNELNRERVGVFPNLFKRIRDCVIDKYDVRFLRALYTDLFSYMCKECLFKQNLNDMDAKFIRKILRESCHAIPLKYLPFKQRILCRYLSWVK